jgi:Flp pilus assembly protein TadG
VRRPQGAAGWRVMSLTGDFGYRSSVKTRDPRRTQDGQTLPLLVLFMFSLIGVAVLVVDVGGWHVQKQQVQAAADAAALAGASQLPAAWSYAQSAAVGEYGKNGKSGDADTVTNTTDLAPNDSVTVTASRVTPGYFTRIFGFSGITVRAGAQATIESVVGYKSTGNVMPWGIMRGSYTVGSSYSMKIANDGSSQSGALDVPYESGCSGSSGSNDYRQLINGTTLACPLSVGQTLSLQSGSIPGPTQQGITDRIGSFKPADQIVTVGPNGTATVIDPNSPQLVLIPIIENQDGSTNWTGGSMKVRIVGFAWFVITSVTGNGQRVTVTGEFVGLETADPNATLGAYTGLPGGATSVELTK